MGFKRDMWSESKTVCYCPKCHELHKRFMMFTGRGIPRIFCEDCLERLDEIGPQWENLNYYKIKDSVNA